MGNCNQDTDSQNECVKFEAIKFELDNNMKVQHSEWNKKKQNHAQNNIIFADRQEQQKPNNYNS